MKIDSDKIKEFLSLTEQAEDFRPIIRVILDTLIGFSDELKEIPEALSYWIIETRISSIRQYEAAGFTREESILMTLGGIQMLKEAMKNVNMQTRKT